MRWGKGYCWFLFSQQRQLLYGAKSTEADPKLSLEGKTQSRSYWAGQEGALVIQCFMAPFSVSHHRSNFLKGMVRTVWGMGPGKPSQAQFCKVEKWHWRWVKLVFLLLKRSGWRNEIFAESNVGPLQWFTIMAHQCSGRWDGKQQQQLKSPVYISPIFLMTLILSWVYLPSFLLSWPSLPTLLLTQLPPLI